MKYLVFGGSGYLGSHLIEQLIKENNEIVIFDNNSGSVLTQFDYPIIQVNGDISKLEDFEKLQSFENFDGVFHLAAKKSVSESFAYPSKYLNTNEYGTRNLVKYCELKQIRNLVFTSSAAVYGEILDVDPIDENYPVNPISPYGKTKLNSELLLSKFCLEKGFKALSLRIFNIVGASRSEYFDSSGENVLPVMLKKMQNNEYFTIFGNSHETKDGTCVRDYVNVRDVAMAHVLGMKYLQGIANGNLYQIVNVSSGVGISLMELIAKFNNLSSKKLEWVYGEKRAGDPSSVIGNNSYARDLLGWEASIGIDKSIAETLGLY